MISKDFLLNSNVVQLDNEYLDMYVELINSNLCTKKEPYKTQVHHIIPKYYFKYFNKDIDNTAANKVNLLYKDHLLAHYYLYKCSSGQFKASNSSMLYIALSSKNYINHFDDINESNELANLLQDAYEYELKLQMNPESDYSKNRLKSLRSINTRNKMSISQKKLIENGTSGLFKARLNPSTANTSHYNDGNINIYVKNGEQPPDNFVKGFLLSDDARSKMGWSKGLKGDRFNTVGGKIVINNGKVDKYINIDDLESYLSTGEWYKGGKSHNSGLWYTNGIINIRIVPGKNIPEGFYRGKSGTINGKMCKCIVDDYEFDFKSITEMCKYLYSICDNHRWKNYNYLRQYILRKLDKNKEVYLTINNEQKLILFNL